MLFKINASIIRLCGLIRNLLYNGGKDLSNFKKHLFQICWPPLWVFSLHLILTIRTQNIGSFSVNLIFSGMEELSAPSS